MNIQTIRDNLIKTIEGKEQYLAQMREDVKKYNQVVNHTVCQFLEVNIDELKTILKDVTICCTNETIATWIESPDRSGGQYTEEEINRGSAW
jgi:predicted HAD superfamily hydrolase